MPLGLTRFHHSGQSHFVTFCCYHRRRLFISDASRRIFESALERVRRSFSLQVYGCVVMPEHVHILLSEPERDANCPTQAKIGLEWATHKSVHFSIISCNSSELTTSRISVRLSATCCACCLPPIILSRRASFFAVSPSIAA